MFNISRQDNRHVNPKSTHLGGLGVPAARVMSDVLGWLSLIKK
ncbi:MAG: hypothetical protein ACI9BF_000112 [Candidatus Paceibacteria bacterium]|jgi:hypothetical protein